jgi:hypothetical protein
MKLSVKFPEPKELVSYADDDKHVCSACFDEDTIQEFIQQEATESKCDYCGAESNSDQPIAAPMIEVLDLIKESIDYDFGDADDEGMIWDREEEEYFGGTTWQTIELVMDMVPTNSDAVFDEIVASLGDHTWCEKDFAVLDFSIALVTSWRRFTETVKHSNRYLFSLHKEEDPDDRDMIPVGLVLDEIGRAIERSGLTKTLPVKTRFTRARVHDPKDRFETAAELGSPPVSKAIYSNRMSPAGIPMFYGAADRLTALKETYRRPQGDKRTVTITTAEFQTSRSIDVIDLTKIPDEPSLFNRQKRHMRQSLRFLQQFVEDLAKPIAKDGREHIEYVPTQIVTEYFRYGFKGGGKVQGLLYPSARKKQGVACVLFFGQNECGGRIGRRAKRNQWLQLDPKSIKRVTRKKR